MKRLGSELSHSLNGRRGQPASALALALVPSPAPFFLTPGSTHTLNGPEHLCVDTYLRPSSVQCLLPPPRPLQQTVVPWTPLEKRPTQGSLSLLSGFQVAQWLPSSATPLRSVGFTCPFDFLSSILFQTLSFLKGLPPSLAGTISLVSIQLHAAKG